MGRHADLGPILVLALSLPLSGVPTAAAQVPSTSGATHPSAVPALRAVAAPPTDHRARTYDDAEASADLWLPPGEWATFKLNLDKGSVQADLPALPALSADAEAAVALAPAWLRSHLRWTLHYLEADRQDELAATLLSLEDPRALDELAFSLAAFSPEELASTYLEPDLLVENALGPYEADPYLAFADLVEEGEAGVDDDYHTTVSYRWRDGDGEEQEWALPFSDYYWYVVHPKLDYELPLYMDPQSSLASPPRGVFWRRWFMFSATEDGTFDYRTHWLQASPNAVADDEPQALWAAGSLTGFRIDPLPVVADEDGRTLCAEVDWGAGTVLATTLDLEAAWAEGVTDLAENALLYIHRRDELAGDERTLILADPDDPDGPMGDIPAAVLTAWGLPWDRAVLDADLAASLAGYTKIVASAGGSPAFYTTLTDYAGELEDFVSSSTTRGTLLLLLDENAAGLDLPGGFQVTAAGGAGATFVGHPVLAETLATTDSLWDGVQAQGLSGERALNGEEHALDAIGWWVTQNMFDNVSEYDATHDDTVRTSYPQIILRNHYGNCGECQDMITAASRAALIPTLNVASMEDHVWSEVFFQDTWHPYQVDWSDGPTRIDYGGVGADGLFGGGKNVSSIKGFQGNGRMLDDHVALYTDTITVEVSLTDADGVPVDGAMVAALSQYYYASGYLDVAAWVHTDQQGHATLHLGDNRDYWILARASLAAGTEAWPFDLDASTLSSNNPNLVLKTEADDPWIEAAEAAAGAVFDFSHQFTGSQGRPTAQTHSGEGHKEVGFTVDLAIEQTLLDVPSEHTYLGWMASLGYAYGGRLIEPQAEPGTVDLYVLDSANLAKFEQGSAFKALYAEEGVNTKRIAKTVLADEDLWIVLSNRGASHHVQVGRVSVALASYGRAGCGCAQGNVPRRGWLLLPGLALMLARRRRGKKPA